MIKRHKQNNIHLHNKIFYERNWVDNTVTLNSYTTLFIQKLYGCTTYSIHERYIADNFLNIRTLYDSLTKPMYDRIIWWLHMLTEESTVSHLMNKEKLHEESKYYCMKVRLKDGKMLWRFLLQAHCFNRGGGEGKCS